MNTVQGIKSIKQIEEMKGLLKKKGARDYLLFNMGINIRTSYI